MKAFSWGLLGPEKIVSERRTRTLGVGAAVRSFNDLAVPGLGNVFFGKQFYLALLGVAIAERLRENGTTISNIIAANAIEALGCWLGFSTNNWQSDTRLRGLRKMGGKNDLSFTNVKKSSFYVTQPMRMVTVQPLMALRYVKSPSERFNAFSIAQYGIDLIETINDAYGPSVDSKNVVDHLFNWISGNDRGIRSSPILRNAISPIETLPSAARQIIRVTMVCGDSENANRRRAILDWVEELTHEKGRKTSWHQKPSKISDHHWKDLHAGALFFSARDAALKLLDQVEAFIYKQNPENPRLLMKSSLPEEFSMSIDTICSFASEFLSQEYDPTPGLQARSFCHECMDKKRIVSHLVNRDGQVLRLINNEVVPGPAFSGQFLDVTDSSNEDDIVEPNVNESVLLPQEISQRVSNMVLLNLDLQGKLGKWLRGDE